MSLYACSNNQEMAVPSGTRPCVRSNVVQNVPVRLFHPLGTAYSQEMGVQSGTRPCVVSNVDQNVPLRLFRPQGAYSQEMAFANGTSLPGPAHSHTLHCKKIIFFPVPIRDFTNQTLPGRELLNNPVRESLVSGIPAGDRKNYNLFYSVQDVPARLFPHSG
jgi:hypothetical protein